MKKKYWIRYLVIIIFLLAGCESFIENEGTTVIIEPLEYPTKQIEGSVEFPVGMEYDLDNLTIETLVGEASFENSTFMVDAVDNTHNVVFLGDSNDHVLLMGYASSEEKELTLNVESTVLAMAMTHPFALSLSESGMANFRQLIKSHPTFEILVNELEIEMGKGFLPLDLIQNSFTNRFIELLNSILALPNSNKQKKLSANDDLIRIIEPANGRFGNTIFIQNPGNPYDTKVYVRSEIDELNTRISGDINLPGKKALKDGVLEAIGALVDITLNEFDVEVVEREYTFESNARHEVVAYTGYDWLFLGADGSERKEAAKLNLVSMAADVFFNIMPGIFANDCKKKLIKTVYDLKNIELDRESLNTPSKAINSAYDLSEFFHDATFQGVICFSNSAEYRKVAKKYMKKLDKMTKWAGWFTNIGLFGNYSNRLGQWKIDPYEQSVCYEKTEESGTLKCDFEQWYVGEYVLTDPWENCNHAHTDKTGTAIFHMNNKRYPNNYSGIIKSPIAGVSDVFFSGNLSDIVNPFNSNPYRRLEKEGIISLSNGGHYDFRDTFRLVYGNVSYVFSFGIGIFPDLYVPNDVNCSADENDFTGQYYIDLTAMNTLSHFPPKTLSDDEAERLMEMIENP